MRTDGTQSHGAGSVGSRQRGTRKFLAAVTFRGFVCEAYLLDVIQSFTDIVFLIVPDCRLMAIFVRFVTL
jgi:hypothetical protein